MSFGREAAPWGARFQAAADAAGRRFRTASERAADRAWYLKYDFVRACRSVWLVARERARLRVDALLWHVEAARHRLLARPAPGAAPERRWVRMAIGAS